MAFKSKTFTMALVNSLSWIRVSIYYLAQVALLTLILVYWIIERIAPTIVRHQCISGLILATPRGQTLPPCYTPAPPWGALFVIKQLQPVIVVTLFANHFTAAIILFERSTGQASAAKHCLTKSCIEPSPDWLPSPTAEVPPVPAQCR